MKSNYFEWKDFSEIYLEDSFVLCIDESDNQISFTLDIVLTESHPMYTRPKPNEQYCYKKGKIIFENLKSVKWLERNRVAFTDANGSEDYGNINILQLTKDGYELSGDWGKLMIKCSVVKLVWL